MVPFRIQPSEKQITAAVIAHWGALGMPDTLVASIPNAGAFGQAGLTKGLPDLLVMGPSVPGRIGFIELKAVRGKPSTAQIEFQSRCAALGISHAITYGRDEPIYTLECWGVVRRAASEDSMRRLKPEPDDQLAALAANGWSSSRIGLELGITRNAVIGRCRRRGFQLLGKSGRQIASTPTTRQFSREAPKIAPLSKKLLAAFAPPVVAAEQRAWPTVNILGLTSLTCRWPIGDTPSDPNFQYCGAPKSIGPYCSDHGLVAYTPRGIDEVRRDDARSYRAA